MNEKRVSKVYRNMQYNKMEKVAFYRKKDNLSRRAYEWMHQKPYGMQDTKGEEDGEGRSDGDNEEG